MGILSFLFGLDDGETKEEPTEKDKLEQFVENIASDAASRAAFDIEGRDESVDISDIVVHVDEDNKEISVHVYGDVTVSKKVNEDDEYEEKQYYEDKIDGFHDSNGEGNYESSISSKVYSQLNSYRSSDKDLQSYGINVSTSLSVDIDFEIEYNKEEKEEDEDDYNNEYDDEYDDESEA